MATIKDMNLQRIRKQGQYELLFYQLSTTVPLNQESDAVRIAVANKVNCHFTAGSLFESLDSVEAIENDTAFWALVASSAEKTFQLSGGATYLKVINDGTVPSIFNVSGI